MCENPIVFEDFYEITMYLFLTHVCFTGMAGISGKQLYNEFLKLKPYFIKEVNR